MNFTKKWVPGHADQSENLVRIIHGVCGISFFVSIHAICRAPQFAKFGGRGSVEALAVCLLDNEGASAQRNLWPFGGGQKVSLKEILHRGAKRPIPTLGPRSENIAMMPFGPKKMPKIVLPLTRQ